MANVRNLLLLLLHTTSVLALTIDPSSLLNQRVSNETSPSRLLELAPHHELLRTPLSAENLTQRSPPLHWEYIHDAYRVILTRKPNSSGHRGPNPGVSPRNWAKAIEDAETALENQRSDAHLPWGAKIPGGSFIFTATLRRQLPRTRGHAKRQLLFRIYATNYERHGLLYDEAWVVLKAYAKYTWEWMTPPGGLANDQIRMARFELLAQGFDDDVRFAHGGVDLFIADHGGGLADARTVSQSRDSS